MIVVPAAVYKSGTYAAELSWGKFCRPLGAPGMVPVVGIGMVGCDAVVTEVDAQAGVAVDQVG